MTDGSSRTPRAPRRSAPFRPTSTLLLLYLFAFFLLYALLLVAPALARVAASGAQGPELQQAAYDAAYHASRGRLPIAAVAALATTVLGAWTGVLPGLRPRRDGR